MRRLRGFSYVARVITGLEGRYEIEVNAVTKSPLDSDTEAALLIIT
jgi:hypothetical protein